MREMNLRNLPELSYATVEAINTLATNLTFAGSQYKSILLTSDNACEGKSYVAFNLVRTLAGMGYNTLLVDADLRKSVFMSRYDVQITGQRIGLAHYLAGHCAFMDVLYKTNLPNMSVIPAGKEVLSSLPLLTSAVFSDLMQHMRESFDFVIVDAPPVGLVIDAAMIATACDATLLVVTNERVSRRGLLETIRQIEKTRCVILGVVLNKVVMGTRKSRKYYYKTYYSHYGAYGTNAYGNDVSQGERNGDPNKAETSQHTSFKPKPWSSPNDTDTPDASGTLGAR